MTLKKDLKTPIDLNWCPGCGNFGIYKAFNDAAVAEGWDNTNTVLTAGIGCHGHMVNFVKLTSFEGLHGRAIPLAAGIKMANHRLNVFVFTGDGDCLAEGGNHFVNAARRNQDITVILHDNAIYGLTTGQTSPSTPKEQKTKSTPEGNHDEPIHPLRLALAAGATFLGRVYAGNASDVKDMIIEANKHKGFSVVQILQPCVTFNKVYTHPYFRENIYKLPDNYDSTNKEVAFAKTFEWGPKKIPVGIFYNVQEPTCEGQIKQIQKKPLIDIPVKRDIARLLMKYK
ncbi:MAG: thiamine pyrophosphate-dependent enzyme [bacterium]|nr:thiamine pyrophosphate-dependent enzyme [bacterium]